MTDSAIDAAAEEMLNYLGTDNVVKDRLRPDFIAILAKHFGVGIVWTVISEGENLFDGEVFGTKEEAEEWLLKLVEDKIDGCKVKQFIVREVPND